MARYSGSTTERGLGWHVHGKPRQQALAMMQEGQLCARCELRGIDHPMTRAVITLRANGKYVAPLLDLDDFPGRAFGGPQIKRLSWRRCNRSAGATMGNRMGPLRGNAKRIAMAAGQPIGPRQPWANARKW